jgi:hypothetical protein
VMVNERRVDPTKSSARAPEVEAAIVGMICVMAGVVLLSFLLGGTINITCVAGPNGRRIETGGLMA